MDAALASELDAALQKIVGPRIDPNGDQEGYWETLAMMRALCLSTFDQAVKEKKITLITEKTL